MGQPFMSTRQRLEAYWPSFDADVLDTVAEAVDHQSDYGSYQVYFDDMGVGEPEVFRTDSTKPISVVDVRPAEHHGKHALWVHFPMANPADPNQRFQLAMLAATNPHTRIIGIGNPGGAGYGTGKLSFVQAWDVAHGKGLGALVEAGHRYAELQGIEIADETGFSYGALKSVISAAMAPYDVGSTVVIEPVLGLRKFGRLKSDFELTAEHIDAYIDAAAMPLYEDARADCNKGLRFDVAFVRASNLAITNALKQVEFEQVAAYALELNETMHLTVASGSESELCIAGLADAMHRNLRQDYSAIENNRVHTIRLPDQYHALANDPALHAALVLQGTRY
jgi:hypothetical protein